MEIRIQANTEADELLDAISEGVGRHTREDEPAMTDHGNTRSS
jgi:hypothetical protein